MKQSYQFAASSAATQFDSDVIPAQEFKQIHVHDMQVSGGTAADHVQFTPGSPDRETVQTELAAAGTSLVVNGDATTGKLTNAYQVLDTDYVIVLTDDGWQCLSISAAVEAAGKTTITVVGLDGVTGVKAIVRAGAPVFIAKTADLLDIVVANTVWNKSILPEYVGKVGAPVAMVMESKGNNAHHMFGIGSYID